MLNTLKRIAKKATAIVLSVVRRVRRPLDVAIVEVKVAVHIAVVSGLLRVVHTLTVASVVYMAFVVFPSPAILFIGLVVILS